MPDIQLESALGSSVYEYTGALTDSIAIITPVNFLPGTKYYMRGYAIDRFGKEILGQQVLEYDPSDPAHNPLACFTASQSVCNAGTCSVNFDASCSTPENLINFYKWDVDGDGFFDFSGADKQKISYLYDVAGTYTVKLELLTSGGITNDSTHIIQVYDDIVADFDIPNGTIYEDCGINFTNNSTGATSYLWDFGDGNTSTREIIQLL